MEQTYMKRRKVKGQTIGRRLKNGDYRNFTNRQRWMKTGSYHHLHSSEPRLNCVEGSGCRSCKRKRQSLMKMTGIVLFIDVLLFVIDISSNAETTSSTHECSFPAFLWYVGGAGGDGSFSEDQYRKWIAEEKHISNAYDFETRKFIVAKETELLLSDQYATKCSDDPCVKTEMTTRLECMRNEGSDKVRAKRIVNGYEDITCFRFVMRTKNIVQVWMSRPSDTDMESLCSANELHRQEWPWIAETPVEWKPCPFSGGYEFRANLTYRNHKKRICERIWKASRLDIECIVGDGMHFTFPETYCSVFHGKEREHSLQCLGSWDEDRFTFLVAAEEGRSPQYVMRLPRVHDRNEMEVQLYFSPVCPLSEKGAPPGQVMYMVLSVKRGETVELATPECDFPLPYQGNWLLFERDRLESVTIARGRFESSVFGHMVCKNKHWERSKYMFASVFNNGCQPRHTCIEFQHDEKEQFLKFRISASNREDHSFDLCHFQSDPPPLGNKYRSPDYKVLLPVSRCRQFSCGLGGLVHLGLTFRDGKTCDGHLSDWNPFTCTLTSALALSYRNCKDSKELFHRAFTCEAYIDLAEGYRMLFTKETLSDPEDIDYSCWLITLTNSSSSNGHRMTWSSAALLSRSHCGLQGGINPRLYTEAIVTFQIYTEPFEKDCIIMTKSAKSSQGIRYSIRKNPKETRLNRPRTSGGPLPLPAELDGSRSGAAADMTSATFFAICSSASLTLLWLLLLQRQGHLLHHQHHLHLLVRDDFGFL